MRTAQGLGVAVGDGTGQGKGGRGQADQWTGQSGEGVEDWILGLNPTPARSAPI